MKLARALLTAVFAVPAFGQYAGPAILSRGEAPTAMAGPQIDFRPFVSINGVYTSGLAGVAVVDSQGNLPNVADVGVMISGGVSGTQKWRHSLLGIDYKGSFTHYISKSFYDSVSQSLSLGVTHQITRHATFSLRESAGMFSRQANTVGLSQTVPFDSSTTYVPNTDFYDNQTIYDSTQADLKFQKSARMSFNLGGDFFLNFRRSKALHGSIGYSARGDMEYRLGRQTTVGVNYSYSKYIFRGIDSGTDIHTMSGTYAVRITRLTEFSGFFGASRVESKFIQSVPVDPAIAAIIGINQTNILVYRIDYYPNFSARLSRTLNHGVIYASGGESITPGNGLFLTSVTIRAGGGYAYTGLRHWSLSLNSTYGKSLSVVNVTGHYGGVTGTFAMSRHLARSINFIANFSANQYRSHDFTRYNRLIYSATIGLGWTPHEVPLRIW